MLRKKETSLKRNTLQTNADSYSNRFSRPSQQTTFHDLSHQLSKRIKTEPCQDENRISIEFRLEQIKNKYSVEKNTSRPLHEIKSKVHPNINSINIKEVDSPISCLRKSSFSNNYFSAKNYDFKSPNPSNPECYYSKPIDNNARRDNIDTINQKIRNILKTIAKNEENYAQPQFLNDSVARVNTPSTRFQSKSKGELNEIDLKVPKLDTRNHSQSSYRRFQAEPRSAQPSEREIRFESRRAFHRDQPRERPSYEPKNEHARQSTLRNFVAIGKDEIQSRQSTHDTFQESIVINKPLDLTDQHDHSSAGQSELMLKLERAKTEANQEVNSRSQSQRKEQTKLLYQRLRRQVELDEHYRNKKYAFKQIRDDTKLDKLIVQLNKLTSRPVSKEQLRIEMVVTEEEYNPFYTCREDGDYSSIAQAHFEANRHWQEQILGKFNYKKLSDERFSEKLVDLQRKGYLVIEDLVRLLNIETDTFVRNRDLVLIYRRFGGQKLLFSGFIKRLCREL